MRGGCNKLNVSQTSIYQEDSKDSDFDSEILVTQLQNENAKINIQLGERDVEMERMKCTLYALNTKLKGVQEVREQLESQKQLVTESEQKCQGYETQIL